MVGSTQYAASPGTLWALVVGAFAFAVIVVAVWVGLSHTRSGALRTLLMGTGVLALVPVLLVLGDAIGMILKVIGV